MKERTAYIYTVHYLAAEFGEENVVIEANSQEEADKKINEWCKNNYCANFESGYPKPLLKSVGYFVKSNSEHTPSLTRKITDDWQITMS